MNEYSHHYAILSVTQETEWTALRARYKRLIGQWHPDRFAGDASQRELAEEHSKQITIAYQALERYYRDNGVLPPMEPATSAESARATVTSPSPTPEGTPRTDGAAPSVSELQPVGRAPRGRQRVLIVISALIVAGYIVFRYASDDLVEADTAAGDAGVAEVAATAPSAREAPPETGGISAGSTLGEVYAIQGIPTLTQGDTWHYGKSSIRFANGKVVSWTQHPDNPLRIARDQPVELRDGVFSIGSTKDEVRAIQGTPVSETESVWDYGPSRVYFEHNRVVRWEASPLQPLRVPR
jgi:DnaJ domain